MSDQFTLFQESQAPLAHRLRPKCLDDLVGQKHILAEGKPLRSWLRTGRIPSLILWGPPGVGKTTLALVIASELKSRLVSLSAVQAGVRELREECEQARLQASRIGARTVLFVDEIHRLNKGQQDALLPYVEDGSVTLIGATTENPSFEVNSALLSRSRVLKLELLKIDELLELLTRACKQEPAHWDFDQEALIRVAELAHGDARRALTLLEALASTRDRTPEGIASAVASLAATNPLRYDKAGEEHFNTISAFIKCMRAGDVDATVYYLARMIEAGEDPLFITRRMVVFAAEDIGNADFRASLIASACQAAVDFVGMPEARINLAQAAIYLARAKKSREAYEAIEAALEEVRETGSLPVPARLRNIGNTGSSNADSVGNLPLGLKKSTFV